MLTHQQDKPADDIGYLCLLEELQPKLDTDDGLSECDEAAEKQGHRTVTTTLEMVTTRTSVIVTCNRIQETFTTKHCFMQRPVHPSSGLAKKVVDR